MTLIILTSAHWLLRSLANSCTEIKKRKLKCDSVEYQTAFVNFLSYKREKNQFIVKVKMINNRKSFFPTTVRSIN